MERLLQLKLKNRTISTELPAFVMGIVNATPDSFFSGSRGGVERAKELISQGADLLDIGGESTKPGNPYISAEEEISRVIPVIQEIRKFSDIPISVDTRKLAVMKAAYDAGADILNDVSALEDDAEMAAWCGKNEIPVILMHKRGTPQTMQLNTKYDNVLTEVKAYFESRIAYAKANGIKDENIILDPGIGFGKNTADNLSLIKNCGKLSCGNHMVLMALSRKTVIGDVTGRPVEQRLAGTITADIISIINGAQMVRVHDVAETIDSIKILKELYI